MAKHEHIQPALLSLAQACRRAGIATETAAKLAENGDFPRVSWVGKKRVVGARAFDLWLTERIGAPAAA
jgi:hypothetical protein